MYKTQSSNKCLVAQKNYAKSDWTKQKLNFTKVFCSITCSNKPPTYVYQPNHIYDALYLHFCFSYTCLFECRQKDIEYLLIIKYSNLLFSFHNGIGQKNLFKSVERIKKHFYSFSLNPYSFAAYFIHHNKIKTIMFAQLIWIKICHHWIVIYIISRTM